MAFNGSNLIMRLLLMERRGVERSEALKYAMVLSAIDKTGTLTATDVVVTDIFARRKAEETPPATPAPEGPKASFEYLSDGRSVQFTDTSRSAGAIRTREWDFGDGDTDTGRNPRKTYDEDGTYEVTLTVTDSAGLSDTASKTLNIGSETPAQLTASFTAEAAADNQLQLTDTSTPPESIKTRQWEVDGSPVRSQDTAPVIKDVSRDVHTVKLTVKMEAGDVASAEAIVIFASPEKIGEVDEIVSLPAGPGKEVEQVTASFEVTLLDDGTLQLTDISEPQEAIAYLLWSIEGIPIPEVDSVKNPVIALAPGTYSISLHAFAPNRVYDIATKTLIYTKPPEIGVAAFRVITPRTATVVPAAVPPAPARVRTGKSSAVVEE